MFDGRVTVTVRIKKKYHLAQCVLAAKMYGLIEDSARPFLQKQRPGSVPVAGGEKRPRLSVRPRPFLPSSFLLTQHPVAYSKPPRIPRGSQDAECSPFLKPAGARGEIIRSVPGKATRRESWDPLDVPLAPCVAVG